MRASLRGRLTVQEVGSDLPLVEVLVRKRAVDRRVSRNITVCPPFRPCSTALAHELTCKLAL